MVGRLFVAIRQYYDISFAAALQRVPGWASGGKSEGAC
jgi:hypothetical protein